MPSNQCTIEAVCAVNGNPLVENVLLTGLRQLHDGLLASKQQPDDLEARQACQLGAWMSAFGLHSRVSMGASHAIGHVLGGTCGVPHDFCTAVMMPSVLPFNLPAMQAAQAGLAAAFGAPGGSDQAAALLAASAASWPQWIQDAADGTLSVDRRASPLLVPGPQHHLAGPG
jgi:maleylacetate reductase